MEFKKGDKYKLILSWNKFTLGKIYECTRNEKNGLYIFDNLNNERFLWPPYFISNVFEKINEEEIEYKNPPIENNKELHKCNCVLRDLLMNGCKCGGV